MLSNKFLMKISLSLLKREIRVSSFKIFKANSRSAIKREWSKLESKGKLFIIPKFIEYENRLEWKEIKNLMV